MDPATQNATRLAIGAATIVLVTAEASAGLVSMRLLPSQTTVARCDLVEIDLVVASEDAFPQPFDALDAVLSWDPGVLEFIGADDSNAEADFFISDFLPDPDGVNDQLDDGEVIFTALAPPGTPIEAPPDPDELTVTTFVFRAQINFEWTPIVLIPEVGEFGETRVLLAGATITGDISSVANVTVGTCPADFDVDDDVAFQDLLRLLARWGPCETSCCLEDINGNGEIEFQDLLLLLSKWGPCP